MCCPCSPRTIPQEDFLQCWMDFGRMLASDCADEADNTKLVIAKVKDQLAGFEPFLQQSRCKVGGNTQETFGLPMKQGVQSYQAKDWRKIHDFIQSRIWCHEEPAAPEDKEDPLLATPIAYGAFMLGFDFHLTTEGPKLIEINTNAGGLATALSLGGCCDEEKAILRHRWVTALVGEYQKATG
eukprot:Sspe_Gene.75449::Locus_47143_Transcript_1_1_Confidence_1.000_Length_1320::g.75449::m.75449